jgi:hypothetical protein
MQHEGRLSPEHPPTLLACVGEFVWRHKGSFHETHSDEGAVILAIYRKPNVFQNSAGYAHKDA